MACCDRHLVRGALFVGSPDQHPSDRHIPLVTATRHFASGGKIKTVRLPWFAPSFRVPFFYRYASRQTQRGPDFAGRYFIIRLWYIDTLMR